VAVLADRDASGFEPRRQGAVRDTQIGSDLGNRCTLSYAIQLDCIPAELFGVILSCHRVGSSRELAHRKGGRRLNRPQVYLSEIQWLRQLALSRWMARLIGVPIDGDMRLPRRKFAGDHQRPTVAFSAEVRRFSAVPRRPETALAWINGLDIATIERSTTGIAQTTTEASEDSLRGR
jgi:hypothetical protein